MNAFSRLALYGILTVSAALGQQGAQNEPHAGYIYPAGGCRGTTFEATIGGRHLNATKAWVSGTGVKAEVIRQERQVTPDEQKALRETLAIIHEKREKGLPVTAEEAEKSTEIREKLTRFGRKLTNPSLGEFVTLRMTVDPKSVPGNREIRLQTTAGLSNPLVFQIGVLPEFSKTDWRNVPKSKGTMDPELDPKPPEKTITLPITLNGQIPPGGLDRYRFAARKGQRLVVTVSARELIPYISDAVPGWFRATVALTAADGTELAYNDDFQFRPDPVLFYQIPADGDYMLHVKDALYRGREDFVYRIMLGEFPYLTAIYPAGGTIGSLTQVAAAGWNLPVKRLPLDLRTETPGIHRLTPECTAGSVPFAVDTLPEMSEIETNNEIASAQAAAVPVIINGRIGSPGDIDVFRIEGRAGDRLVAEVQARRLDSPLDSMLILTDLSGKQLAFNDDHEDKASGLNTHHADSYLTVTIPTTGAYFIHLGDTQQAGGATHLYRLRIGPPRPDFELRVTPSTLNVHGGASVPVTVHAMRKDGFTGPIALRLKNAPPGLTLTAAEIPEGKDMSRFTLNAPASNMEPFTLAIEGISHVGGKETVRPAVPADDLTQAFAYRHLVTARELKVAVIGRFRPGENARILSKMPILIPFNGSAIVRASVPVGPMITHVDFELNDPPAGISLKSASVVDGTGTVVLEADSAKIKAGFKGIFILSAFAQVTGKGGARRIPLGSLPAIPFEIISGK